EKKEKKKNTVRTVGLFKWGIGLAVLFNQPEVTDGEYPLSVGTGQVLFCLLVGTGSGTFGLSVGIGFGLPVETSFGLPVETWFGLATEIETLLDLRGTACGTK
ncbi:hypothetical protein Tco_0144427, partial [Tanacetum coccineum]